MTKPFCATEGCFGYAKNNGYGPTGKPKYQQLCPSCAKRKYGDKAKLERFKKGHCELCGFQPKHLCQLDVDHIDGDHTNDDPSNHQTLCANCHRLKTFLTAK